MKSIKLSILSTALLSATALAQTVPVASTEVAYEFEAAPASGWNEMRHPTLEPQTRMLTTAGTTEWTVNVDVKHKAKYYIWIRAYAPSQASKSVFVSYNDESTATGVFFPTTSKGRDEPLVWQKVEGARILKPGVTKLRIKRRDEPGLGLDQIIVTAQPNFDPNRLSGPVGAATIHNSLPPLPEWTPEGNAVLPAVAPRLFLPRAMDLQPLRDAEANRAGDPNDAEYVLVRGAWDRLKAAADKTSDFASCNERERSIKAKALYYRLYGNAAVGDDAVSMLRTYLEDCADYYVNSANEPTSLKTRPTGEMITVSALVYDWVLSTKTDAAAEADRELIIRRFLERAAMEIGFPPTTQNPIAGHGAEAQLLRDQLSAAVAFADRVPGIYTIVGKRFFKDFVPVRDYVYGSGGFHQGTSYGPYRYQWDMYAAWLYKRMNGVNVFSDEQELQLYHSLYQRRPDGQLMRDGDVYHSNYFGPNQYWTEPMAFMLAANYYNNARLKREFVRQVNARIVQWAGKEIIPHDDDLWVVLFSDPSVKPAAESVAPSAWPSLSRYFGVPNATMIARTGWTAGYANQTNADVVVASMKVGHSRFGGHQHRDAGHFEIFYKGSLASSSGIYQGLNDAGQVIEYSGTHDLDYYKRTVAHNAMTVRDPNEKFDQDRATNDGGQLFERDDQPESLAALQTKCTTQSKCYAYGRGIKQRIGVSNDGNEVRPPFSYLMGDITDAYSDKVSAYQRGFVFLNLEKANVPAALIVFDRIKAAANDYQKRWLLHSVKEPQVAGNTITITSPNGAGKLFNQTLLPAATKAEKIEGYVVNGVPYNIKPQYYTNSEEQGRWRVEVNPDDKASEELLLNVMQVIDVEKNGTNGPLVTQLLSDVGQTMVGVRIDNRAVYFAKSALPISAETTLKIDTTPADLLVTGLATGTWAVTLPGGAVVRQTVADSHGTVYLPAAATGTYVLKLEAPL